MTVFIVSWHWVYKFRRRKELCLRRRVSISQKLLDAYKKQLIEFQSHLKNLHHSKVFLLKQIGDANQTRVYLDMPSPYPANEKGARQVLVGTTGNEKMHVTIMLACTAD